MENKKDSPSRLGRGLSALIPATSRPDSPASANRDKSANTHSDEHRAETDHLSEIPLAAIVPNTSQPRTAFDESSLQDLAASVAAHGVLQPIMVREVAAGRYELIAGERRFRAAERAGLSRIPAIVRQIDDEESLVVALIENIQREDLNAIEAARGYHQLLTQFHVTQTELARQIGKGLSTISNSLRLLDLPTEVQDSIARGKITAEHGKVLLSISDRARLLAIWSQVVAKQVSVKATYALIESGTLSAGPAAHNTPTKDVHWQALEDRVRTALGMKIALKPGRAGRGTLTIEFSSEEEIDDLLSRFSAE